MTLPLAAIQRRRRYDWRQHGNLFLILDPGERPTISGGNLTALSASWGTSYAWTAESGQEPAHSFEDANWNGKPSITGAGTDRMHTTGNVSCPSTEITIATYYRPTSVGTTMALVESGTGTTAGSMVVLPDGGGVLSGAYQNPSSTFALKSTAAAALAINTKYRIQLSIDANTANTASMVLRLNGASVGSFVLQASNAGTVVDAVWQCLARSNGSLGTVGSIPIMLVYSGTPDFDGIDEQMVELYG